MLKLMVRVRAKICSLKQVSLSYFDLGLIVLRVLEIQALGDEMWTKTYFGLDLFTFGKLAPFKVSCYQFLVAMYPWMYRKLSLDYFDPEENLIKL